MAPHRVDAAHPAFAKMFVQTECLPDSTLIAHRRQRSPEECAGLGGAQHGRRRRGHSARNRPGEVSRARQHVAPAGCAQPRLSGTAGTVLDPIFSLRCTLTLEPRERAEITFVTACRVLARANCSPWWTNTTVPNLSLARSRWRGRARSWNSVTWESDPRPRTVFRSWPDICCFRIRECGRRRTGCCRTSLANPALWAHGISGDLPILCRDGRGSAPSAAGARTAAGAHLLASARIPGGSGDSESGKRKLRSALRTAAAAADRSAFRGDRHRPARRRFPARLACHSGGERSLILASSSVVLSGSRGPLQQQLVSPEARPAQARFSPPARPKKYPPHCPSWSCRTSTDSADSLRTAANTPST